MIEKDLIPFHDEGFTRVPNQVNKLYVSDEEYPDTFVRVVESNFRDEDEPELLPLEEISIGNVQEAKRLFQELTDVYQVKTAGFEPVIFETDNTETKRGVMIVSNLLKGEVINAIPNAHMEIGNMPDYARKPGKALVNKLTLYYLDKLQNGEPYLYDLCGIRQYTLTEAGEFVLHDMEPMFLNQEKTKYKRQNIAFRFDYLADIAQACFDSREFEQWQSKIKEALAPSSV